VNRWSYQERTIWAQRPKDVGGEVAGAQVADGTGIVLGVRKGQKKTGGKSPKAL
jgi:hypothetical protein